MKVKQKKDNVVQTKTTKTSWKQSEAVKCLKKNKMTYMFLIPGIILTLVFCYIPMGGLYIAFVDYNPFEGIMGSPFVGLENVKEIFQIPAMSKAIFNTLKLSLLNLALVFPLPLIFALLLNEIRNIRFKRFVQTVSYLPHFISTIAVVGIATTLYSSSGIINDIRVALFGAETERILFLSLQDFFVPNILILTVWQSIGWSSILYLSALSGIDPELYEAAVIDGAGKFRQCRHITLPCLSTTIIMLLVLQIGGLFTSNFDLIYGLQNTFIDFEVISTAVYKQGIENGNYPVATALSFLSGIMSLILILGSNYFSKKINDVSLI